MNEAYVCHVTRQRYLQEGVMQLMDIILESEIDIPTGCVCI